MRVPRRISIAALACLVLSLAACAGEPKRDFRAGESAAGPEGPPPTAARLHAGGMTRIESAIHRYAADRAGRLPASLAVLTTEVSPEGDHYLTSVPRDPWGRPYAYAVVAPRLGAYDLRSYGPDTLPGTDDDVVADSSTVPVR